MIAYEDIDEDFYEEQTKSKNLLRSWFHNSRHKIVFNYVNKYRQDGMKIADLGCGNVIWNYSKVPVIGVDVNEKFLNLDLKNNTINEKVVCELDNIKLPNESVDIVIVTEVLEHLPDLEKHLAEIRRILKPGGIVISSVPYDTNLSLWKPLFFVQCLIQGYIYKNDYYKNKCGHINHFSKKSIKELFTKNNFNVIEQSHNFYFTIFTIAQK